VRRKLSAQAIVEGHRQRSSLTSYVAAAIDV
jgi:hypothetical protein